jgi:hypothetical protein
VIGCLAPTGSAATCAANSNYNDLFSQTGTASSRATNLTGTVSNLTAQDLIVVNVATGDATQIVWTAVLEF